MSWSAVVLVLISAGMHAGWNLFGKRQRTTAGFFLIACLPGVLYQAVVALFLWPELRSVPARVHVLNAATGFFQALYFVGLAGAYRHGEMSRAYPLARATPVVFVFLVSLAIGNSQGLGPLLAAGMALLVPGCFLLPMRRFSELRLRDYAHPWCLFALLAALGTTGYSILDDQALRLLRETGPGNPGLSPQTAAAVFLGLEFTATAAWLGVFVAAASLFSKGFAARTFDVPRGKAALTGVFIMATYLLVLIAMAFAENISYIVAFRQVSIPLGALLGILVLKEPHSAPKIVGVALAFAGLVLVKLA